MSRAVQPWVYIRPVISKNIINVVAVQRLYKIRNCNVEPTKALSTELLKRKNAFDYLSPAFSTVQVKGPSDSLIRCFSFSTAREDLIPMENSPVSYAGIARVLAPGNNTVCCVYLHNSVTTFLSS